MKVHLLRSQEFNVEEYLNVSNVLSQYAGPIQFVQGESNVIINSLKSEVWEREEGVDKKKDITPSSSVNEKSRDRFHSWDYLFGKCELYRRQNNIPQNDHVFLLTDLGNERNWFGAAEPSNKDYFIQTSEWEKYVGSNVDSRFPIAYEVAIWLLRTFMFDRDKDILGGVHNETRGCGNDFCKDKTEVILKMRTADLCSSCLKILAERNASPLMVNQLFSIMDGIRTSMTFRNRMALMQSPSRIEVRDYTMRIFLTDLGDLELNFNPKEKAIYLFYLNHTEGVHLNSLQDHQEEIVKYYSRFSSHSETLEIERSIARLVDPLDNDINVVLSRIKRKLRITVGNELLNFYVIDGPHGGDKRIILDREFVSFSQE